MNDIKLVIQRTSNGLVNDFVSNDLALNQPEISKVLADERNAAQQVGLGTIFYSLHNTVNYIVYSLINATPTDNSGRSGYYAIRLFVPQNMNKTIRAEQELGKLKAKYENYLRLNQREQNYDDILSNILLDEISPKRFFQISLNRDYYFYNDNKDISAILKEERLVIFQKVYIFDKSTAQSESMANNLHLSPFQSKIGEVKVIVVNNQDSYLSDILINGTTIEFYQEKIFKVICLNSDTIQFKTRDNSTIQNFTNGTQLEIKKPVSIEQQITSPTIGSNRPARSSKFPTGTLVAGIILGIIVGLGGGYFLFNTSEKTPSQDLNSIPTDTPSQIPSVIDFGFSLDPNVNTITFNSTYKGIEDYKFHYNTDKKTWDYVKGFEDPNALNSDAIGNFLKKPGEVDAFKNQLKKISGRPISDENISTRNKPDSNQESQSINNNAVPKVDDKPTIGPSKSKTEQKPQEPAKKNNSSSLKKGNTTSDDLDIDKTANTNKSK